MSNRSLVSNNCYIVPQFLFFSLPQFLTPPLNYGRIRPSDHAIIRDHALESLWGEYASASLSKKAKSLIDSFTLHYVSMT